MPQPPGFLNRFNFVKFFLFNKCHHPWTLYVETVFPPAVGASHTLLMFDMGDALRSLFRPKGTRTKRHGRKASKRRGGGAIGPPEPSDLLAGPARETFELDARPMTQGTKTLWTIDTVAQKWLGRLMMIEVVEEFLFRWALLIGAKDGQHCTNQHAVRAEGIGGYAAGGGAFFLTAVFEVWKTGGADCISGVVYNPAPRWMMIASCHLKHEPALGFEDVSGEFEMFILSDHKAVGGGKVTLARRGEVDLVVTAFMDSNDLSSCRCYVKSYDACRAGISQVVYYAQEY